MISHFMYGFAAILEPQCLILILVGVAIGILFGAIPGLTSVMAVALFLPVTYNMDPATGIAVLVALYVGATSGGLISAILLKIPGTPASVATCFDGHPMVEKGEGAKALGVGVVFSFFGTVISIAALVFIAPALARVALRFGPHEYFAIAVFSLTLIASISTGSLIKGIFSGTLGFAFATVGIAPVDAVARFTLGNYELNSGFATLTVLIGLFAIAEIIKTAENIKSEEEATISQVNMKSIKGFGFSLKEMFGQTGNFLRSSLIGIGVGILPGIGAGTSNIIAYIFAQKRSKYPEKFGTGIIDGVVAPETANNAGIGGAMIPLMTLGIPGDATTALLLGGFMVHGIAPGPMLFTQHATLVYTIFAGLIVSAFAMLIIEFYGLRIFIHLLKVPKYYLLPLVFILCVVGAFGLNSRVFDVWTILVFGIVGYGFMYFSLPQAPFIIGFILGPMAETNLRRGLMLSDGSFYGFFENSISAAFLLLSLASVILSTYGAIKKYKSQSAGA